MKTLLALFIAILLCSCVHNKINIQPICRHISLFCAITVGEKYPVRIVYGEIWSGEHAEAQAYIESEWKRLKLVNGKIEVDEKKTDWIIIYEEYVDMERALKWSTRRFKSVDVKNLDG